VTHSYDESENQGRGPEEPVVVRDRRRVDPQTGQVRPPGPAHAAPDPDEAPVEHAGPSLGESIVDDSVSVVSDVEKELAERTADLQRLQAEYANYRRRVERDRAANREAAVAAVLTNFIPVLDDIGRAREHDELEGGFRSVGEALEQTVEKLGLTRFGEPGDPFDPKMHEALTHAHSAEVTEPTCVQIFSPGYRIGDRIVRPARVGVVEPE